MTTTRRQDLDHILDAIREVEASLETRGARAAAATGMVWGLVASAILLFYHWVHADAAAFAAVVPPALLAWAWVPAVAFGYVATAAIGARLGRATSDPDATRDLRRLLLALAVPLAVTAVSVVTARGHPAIPGMWVAFLGVPFFLFHRRAESPWRRPGRAIGVASVAAGAALAAVPALAPWAYLLAGAWYVVFLFGYCSAQYHALGR